MCTSTCTHVYIHMYTCVHPHVHMCTSTCTHVYIHMYTCVHPHVHMCTSTCTHVYIHMYTCVHPHVHMCTSTCTHVYIHMYTCVHPHVHMCTSTCTHVYIHMYTCVHPHVHMCTSTCTPASSVFINVAIHLIGHHVYLQRSRTATGLWPATGQAKGQVFWSRDDAREAGGGNSGQQGVHLLRTEANQDHTGQVQPDHDIPRKTTDRKCSPVSLLMARNIPCNSD